MTTPTPSPTTQPTPLFPAGPPRPAPGRRRWLIAGLVALLVVVAAAVAVRWTRDGDSGPLAGRPRVTDARAGLSYGIPDGWKHDAAKDKDLIGAFSSQISSVQAGATADTGATVLAGRAGQVVPRADLGRTTEAVARSNAEFFFPDRPAALEDSHDTVVDGRPAHTAVLRIKSDEGTARLQLTVVTVDGERTSFLLGLTTGAVDPAVTEDVEAVLAGATVD
ncbi:hypothetical protein JK359_11190 [Streptomyces actinomycinicus]|uniref:Uncharacterized protein n=1 Tax=Streptomyces actinomycinicus TaxID=1695166 RepID=A0A937JKH9_9ACTN|nr:hypothetical protein [Streptomyces actinomycinicus]MBL1082539.1 hypothetical protein [Streptomyces actinomycinicus]